MMAESLATLTARVAELENHLTSADADAIEKHEHARALEKSLDDARTRIVALEAGEVIISSLDHSVLCMLIPTLGNPLLIAIPTPTMVGGCNRGCCCEVEHPNECGGRGQGPGKQGARRDRDPATAASAAAGGRRDRQR